MSDAPTPSVPPAPPARRSPLPWQAVVAATALAASAALVVVVALGGTDDAAVSATAADDTSGLSLTPLEDVDPAEGTDVAFTRIDGSEATLSDVVEGPTVVNFFASWCPPCISEMPDFEAASQVLGDRVTFFGLAVQDRPEDAERIVADTGISYGWGRDIRGDVAGAVGVIQMPTTMFLDADGTIVAVHAGALDEAELIDLIEEHLGVTS